MFSLVRGGGGTPLKSLALVLGIWGFSGSLATCRGGNVDLVDPQGGCPPGFGTLGWGPPGCQPGFQGFGRYFHRGYGYGGDALGVGAEGGYPFYGGLGYLHPSPPLRRFGPATPFSYFGNPGPPLGFDGPGSLAVSEPVVLQIGVGDPGLGGGAGYSYSVGYGLFSGARPYPESYFAPYTAAAAGGLAIAGEAANSSTTAVETPRIRDLGVDEESVIDANGARRIKVARVRPGSAAEKAGLKPGDVIQSINGYRMEQRGNLAWILAHAAPDGILTIKVRSALDAQERTITARLP